MRQRRNDERTLGNYVLGPLLGRGGMSDVHAATHRFLGDRVAIKLLRTDLARDPLLRGTLLTADTTHPTLVLAMHHLVTDWWSFDVLHTELVEVYQALRTGTAPRRGRPKPPVGPRKLRRKKLPKRSAELCFSSPSHLA